MKKIITIILSLTIGLSFTSCEDWLGVKPENTIPAKEALATLDGNLATLMSCYNFLQNAGYYGRTSMCVPEILADNAKIATANSNRYISEYQNDVGAHVNNWQFSWRIISSANYILKYIDQVPVIASDSEFENTRTRTKGECYFLRGWQMFELARTYSREPGHTVLGFEWGVPIITEPFEYNNNLPALYVKRATVTETYTQIIDDLTKAFNILNGLDGAKNTKYFPYRASALASKAALARAYLYAGMWSDAVREASWVISNAGFGLETDTYKNIFAKDAEGIFILKFTTANSLIFNSLQSIYMRSEVKPQDAEGYYIDEKKGSGYGDIMFSEDIYAMYDPGDMRLSTMIKVKNNTSEKGIWLEKFTGSQGAFGLDNIPIFRLSEMYLIRAEASMKLPTPDEVTALSDLNTLRSARKAVTKSETGSALAIAIQNEKRKEYVGEGHRFFDLKRQGLDIPKSRESGRSTITYDDYRVVARIPAGEIPPNGSNPNMIQNPGF